MTTLRRSDIPALTSSKGGHMASVAAAKRTLGRTLPPWWWLLITGIAWMLVALILLRFDYTSVSAISILFGVVAIMAGVLEFGVMFMAALAWGTSLGMKM